MSLRAARPDLTSRIDEVVQNLDDSITLLRQSIFALEQDERDGPAAGQPGPP